jgi:hypothetical protein
MIDLTNVYTGEEHGRTLGCLAVRVSSDIVSFTNRQLYFLLGRLGRPRNLKDLRRGSGGIGTRPLLAFSDEGEILRYSGRKLCILA